MSRWVFRIAAGVLCIVETIAGVSMTLMYEGWWDKFCSVSLVAMGLYFGLYAIRGNTRLRTKKYVE
jgi:uncharacterized membrane protein